MLSSMTAYGRACLVTAFGRLVVEVQSVNRRFLEVSVVLPPELAHFEMEIRRWIGNAVGRGQVMVRVQAFFEASAPLRAVPNLHLARQLCTVWQELGQAVGVTVEDADLIQILAKNEDITRYECDVTGDHIYLVALQDAVTQALESFLAMRRQEGEALQRDISARSAALRASIEVISGRSGEATEKYRQRLMTRLQELLPDAIENEERLLREVCVFADRVDISEELTRFRSHLEQFDATMQSDKPSVGKTLDFILQELHREINTVGSKSADYAASQVVVEIKAELERIREQLQNVE